ncbi:14010_t:CDS:1, partial [Gigaspora rosea]
GCIVIAVPMLDSCFIAVFSSQFEVYIRYMGLDRLRFFSLDWASLVSVIDTI